MAEELVRQVAGVGLQNQSHYIIKRKFWSIFERVFRVFTGDGQMIMYVKHPLMKLREEFMVHEDEAQTKPVMRVKSQQVIAINFSYEVTDTQTGAVIGTVEKKGFASLFRDKFIIKDATGTEVGYAQEQGAAFLRRIFPLMTSKHAVFVDGQQAAWIQQKFRFFTKEFAVTLSPSRLDPKFVLAVALLALMAEARREDKN